MKPIHLVLHDWRNLPPAERTTALADIHALAATFGEASLGPAGRRARALNIVASFFEFLDRDDHEAQR